MPRQRLLPNHTRVRRAVNSTLAPTSTITTTTSTTTSSSTRPRLRALSGLSACREHMRYGHEARWRWRWWPSTRTAGNQGVVVQKYEYAAVRHFLPPIRRSRQTTTTKLDEGVGRRDHPTTRTHEVRDQPTIRLPHRPALRGQPSRRSQSVRCEGEHGQQQPRSVHPPRKPKRGKHSGTIPRRKVRIANQTHALLSHSNVHREHARPHAASPSVSVESSR